MARIPYFVFTSMLHLSDTLSSPAEVGAADNMPTKQMVRLQLMNLHFEQSTNEQQHLLIMEALGGGNAFVDRFISMHMAVFYFFLTTLLYWQSPVQVRRRGLGPRNDPSSPAAPRAGIAGLPSVPVD